MAGESKLLGSLENMPVWPDHCTCRGIAHAGRRRTGSHRESIRQADRKALHLSTTSSSVPFSMHMHQVRGSRKIVGVLALHALTVSNQVDHQCLHTAAEAILQQCCCTERQMPD